MRLTITERFWLWRASKPAPSDERQITQICFFNAIGSVVFTGVVWGVARAIGHPVDIWQAILIMLLIDRILPGERR